MILALISLVAAACGGDDDEEGGADGEPGIVENEGDDEEAGDPVMGGTLNYGVEAESGGWQPCVDAASESGAMAYRALYDQLMARTDEGTVEPYLAQSLEGSADLKEWTLKLRPNVKFHDGTPLDAAAVKANFDAAKLPTSRCASTVAPITEMQVVDPLTVKYILAAPYGPFAELLTTGLGQIFSPTNAQAKGADVSANPVGAGPFKFQSWERDSKLTLVKNEDYWQEGLPYLDSVVFRPIPDEDARLASLSSGEVDIMFTLRQEYVRQARELGDSVKRIETIGNNSGSSIMNTAIAPLDDVRVRKGLAHGANQPDLIKILGGEGITPETTQFFSQDSPWYSEKVAKAYPKYDVEAGKKLIDEYIKDPQRSDKQPVGSPVKIVYNCPPDPTLVALSQAYQQMAREIGVEMELKQVEQATHINNALGKPPFTNADYMMQCWRLGGQTDPDTTLFNQYGPVEGNALNVTNFSTPEVQALLKTGRESSDFDVRYKAYEDLHMIFNEQVPHIWTGATAASTAFKPEVTNVGTFTFPDGKTKGKMEQGVARLSQIWIKK